MRSDGTRFINARPYARSDRHAKFLGFLPRLGSGSRWVGGLVLGANPRIGKAQAVDAVEGSADRIDVERRALLSSGGKDPAEHNRGQAFLGECDSPERHKGRGKGRAHGDRQQSHSGGQPTGQIKGRGDHRRTAWKEGAGPAESKSNG